MPRWTGTGAAEKAVVRGASTVDARSGRLQLLPALAPTIAVLLESPFGTVAVVNAVNVLGGVRSGTNRPPARAGGLFVVHPMAGADSWAGPYVYWADPAHSAKAWSRDSGFHKRGGAKPHLSPTGIPDEVPSCSLCAGAHLPQPPKPRGWAGAALSSTDDFATAGTPWIPKIGRTLTPSDASTDNPVTGHDLPD